MPAAMPPSGAPHRTYSFDDFTLDVDRGALQHAGKDIRLRPKSFEVLSYLVERHGCLVSRDELLDAIWGGAVVTEDAVTQCLIDIRRAIRDQSQKKIRTVPRRGYIFDLPVTQPGGPIPAADLPHSTDVRSGGTHWQSGVALLLIVGFVAVWWANGKRAVEMPDSVDSLPAAAEFSIAVLPFVDMSPQQDQAYFADGVSEEILNLLAQVPELRVIARTSSFSFKGQDVDITAIKDQLNVTHVLEGSVRKAGNRVRITAQLVNASNSAHLWSQTYDRELENTFAVQDEISAAIVRALGVKLGIRNNPPSRNVASANSEAHEAYLRGRHLAARRTQVGIESAIREFEKAISLDPDYAIAHAELALVTQFGYLNISDSEAVDRAASHVEKAMAIDPALAEVHAAAGYLAWQERDADEALRSFRKAIELNPSYANAYAWMAGVQDNLFGRYDESIVLRETAARLDPLSIPVIAYFVDGLLQTGRLAEADKELEKLASLAPYIFASVRGQRLSIGGNWAQLVLGDLESLKLAPESVRVRRQLARGLAIIGLGSEALEVWEPVEPETLRILGKSADAAVAAEARLAANPSSLTARDDLGLARAAAGDFAGARLLLEDAWLRSGRRVVFVFPVDNAAALIAARRDHGKESNVDSLIAAIKDDARRYREAGVTLVDTAQSADYEEGLAAYLAGERGRGLALISTAAEQGFFIPQSEAYLQPLYDDPDFAEIRERQKARQARERAKVLAIVCNDNPYSAVWQPAKQTCELSAELGRN